MCVGVLLLIVACQPHLPIVSAGSTTPASDSASDIALPVSQISPDLLYDILVATIAAKRNYRKLALKFLSRAAYRSKDSRLIIEAIRFALTMKAYQHASELAQFFNRLEPDNQTATLLLARTQFELGNDQYALQLLTDLTRNKTDDDVLILQNMADLLAEQERQTVLSGFAKYLEKTPTNQYLILTAALLASNLGNADEYIRLLDDSLKLKPDWEAVGILKLIALSDDDIDRLNGFATTHLNRHPRQSRFRLEYVQRLIQQNEIDGALNHIKQILLINPNSTDALFLAGLLYLNKNLLEEAKKVLLRYLELGATEQNQTAKTQDRLRDDQSRMYLADIELTLKNYSAAASYLHGVSSPPYYLEAQIKMGWVIAGRDDVDSALAHLRQIDTFNVGQKIQIILAQNALLKARNRLSQSRLVLDEGLKQYPEHSDLLYSRGLLAAQMNFLALHERDMRKIIALQPENAHAYNALGYTLADQTDRLDEALALIIKAHKLLPDNPSILDSMGWVHFKLGNIAQAITFLRRAFHISHHAEIAAHLGEVLWVSDNKEEAMKIWTQAMQREPENLILKNTIKRFSQQQSGNQSSVILWDLSITTALEIGR